MQTTHRRTRRWLTVVGAFYLALVVMNVAMAATGSKTIEDSIPFEADANTVHAFLDAWMTFILALGALGVAALIASRRAAQASMLVLAIILGEAAYGVAGDVWLIARGYDAAGYIAFSLLHLVIIGTGVWVLRSDFGTQGAGAPVAVPAGARA